MIWRDLPKGFSVKRHLEAVRRVANPYRIYLDMEMSDLLLEDVVDEVATKRGYRNKACLRTKLQAVLPYNGETVKELDIQRLGMFILENHTVLKSGEYFPDWNGRPLIWIAGIVTTSSRDESTRGKGFIQYIFRVLPMIGPPAGVVIESKITARYAAYLPMILGAPSRTDHNIIPEDAMGMVLYAQVGAVPGKNSMVHEVTASSSMKTRNKNLFKRRHP